MEFARRYAGGTLSEVFGAKTLPMDRFARTLGFRRTAEGIYANLDAPTRVLLQRYSDGINAYLELAPAALPLEFSLVRHERPGPWGPVDSLSLHLLYSWTLSANLGMQLQRLALAEHLDLARINEVFAPIRASGRRPPATTPACTAPCAARRTPASCWGNCPVPTSRASVRTTGWSPPAAAPPASRCWPTIRTCA